MAYDTILTKLENTSNTWNYYKRPISLLLVSDYQKLTIVVLNQDIFLFE